MRSPRFVSTIVGGALVALLAACGTRPSTPVSVVNVPPPTATVNVPPPTYPQAGYPAPTAQTAPAPMGTEYGRVTNIEYFPGGVSRSGMNVPGAILGAVAGGVLGNQVGSGRGRDAATVLGAAGGAAVGSQVGRSSSATDPVYRVTVQTDQGVIRYYDVPATGDLRVGDRVRVENGVIYRG